MSLIIEEIEFKFLCQKSNQMLVVKKAKEMD